MTQQTALEFRALRLPLTKRLFDVFFVLITAVLTVPLGLVIWVLIRVREGGPVFYKAARSGQGGRVFMALKFRTMREVDAHENTGVSGGDKTFRISRFCAFLRRTRLDELPQLFNVLRGDMSLVGPRPPDPHYVEKFPHIYSAVLRSRPGLTGLATLYMHRFEDRVLKQCSTPQETEEVYCRRCVPRKAKLDLMYQERLKEPNAICFDLWIIARSISSVLR